MLGTVVGHRFANWREEEPANMLHPSGPERVSMGRAIMKYFQALYHIVPCHFTSKRQGIYEERFSHADNNAQ